MTNQTTIFCKKGVFADRARVGDFVDTFIIENEGMYTNFHVLPVIVSPSPVDDIFWFIIQVNYYDPNIQ